MGDTPSDKPPQQPASPPFPEQDEYGIDLSLIRENLRLTPAQRLARAEAGRRNLLMLRHAKRIQ